MSNKSHIKSIFEQKLYLYLIFSKDYIHFSSLYVSTYINLEFYETIYNEKAVPIITLSLHIGALNKKWQSLVRCCKW